MVNLLSWAVLNVCTIAGPSPITLIDESLQVYSVNGINTGIVNIVSVELWVAASPETWDSLVCMQVKLYPTIFATWLGGFQFNVTLRGRKVVLMKFLGVVVYAKFEKNIDFKAILKYIWSKYSTMKPSKYCLLWTVIVSVVLFSYPL